MAPTRNARRIAGTQHRSRPMRRRLDLKGRCELTQIMERDQRHEQPLCVLVAKAEQPGYLSKRQRTR